MEWIEPRRTVHQEQERQNRSGEGGGDSGGTGTRDTEPRLGCGAWDRCVSGNTASGGGTDTKQEQSGDREASQGAWLKEESG